VLRNNDVGDVLLATPLLSALRRLFPAARIGVGVGHWSAPVLFGNPNIDEVLAVSAPWFNRYAPDAGILGRIAYILRSPEISTVRAQAFEIGIDVLGSGWGSLFLIRSGIPWRLGVRGYAGGHTGASLTIPYRPDVHVARFGLGFAETLGARWLPDPRPQVFLAPDERDAAEKLWGSRSGPRVLLAPGGGLPQKCWPMVRYADLATALAAHGIASAVLLGPKERGAKEAFPRTSRHFVDLGLRQAFAAVAAADCVVTSPSMVLHAAAAFERPCLVLLGPAWSSTLAHDRQWGYPGLSATLGPEPGQRGIADGPEALKGTLRLIEALRVAAS